MIRQLMFTEGLFPRKRMQLKFWQGNTEYTLGAKGSIPETSEHIHTNITEQIPVIFDGRCEME